MATFGKVNDRTAEFHFEWQIDDFFSLPEEDGETCFSPNFSIAGESWCFFINPNGKSAINSVGYVGAYLQRNEDLPYISLVWSFGVKTSEGKKDKEMKFSHVFHEESLGYGFAKFLKRSELFEKKSELVPSDVLTLVCDIEYHCEYTDGAGN